MPATETATADQPFFAEGMTVEVGKIQRELKKLWQNSQESATRASRLNLVIFSAADHSLRTNTAIVEKITQQHALRAILIASKANTGHDGIRAWVNAHCQVSKDGRKQRCSEQIGLLLEGRSARRELVPNIIFSHLDSDLPLYLWRQGEFSDSPNEQLMAWVDCLLFDSGDWAEPRAQFRIVRKIAAAAKMENSLADLNWTRIAGLRAAVSQFFDAPGGVAALAGLDAVEIVHGPEPGVRTRALLLSGWLAAQLGWQSAGGEAGVSSLEFQTATGGKVTVKLSATGAANSGISRASLHGSDGSEFVCSREAGSDFYNTSGHCGGSGREQCQLLPVGPEDVADLVSAELVHGGAHGRYLRAVASVAAWLE